MAKEKKRRAEALGVEDDVLNPKDRARLNTEWSVLNALRELAHIALRTDDPPTYRRVLRLGEALLPGVFSVDERIIDRAPESKEARYWREMSVAETKRLGSPITATYLISEEIKRLEEAIKNNPESTIARSKLHTAMLVKVELTPTSHSENQLIFRDALATGLDLGDPSPKSFGRYKEYKLANDRALRINVFHPDFPEHKTGADLLYEMYDTENQTARVAAVQYKMWDGKSLYKNPQMDEQLIKLAQFACEQDYADFKTLCSKDLLPIGRTYRLPHCAVFLRPTERLQLPNSQMISTGQHVPVCVASTCWVLARKNRVLRRSSIIDRSLSEKVFKELFLASMVGSQSLSYEHLTALYRKIGIFDQDQNIVLHAQEFDLPQEFR